MKMIKLLTAGVVLVFVVLIAVYAVNLSAADDVTDERLALHGLDENLRFEEPVTISVALWDRHHGRIPDFSQSYWANWVAEQMLERHNVVVEWRIVPRWEESVAQHFLLASAWAPDIGYTFSVDMIGAFSELGQVVNLLPYLQNYGDWLPNLYDLLGENIYWGLNTDETELFYLTGVLHNSNRQVTFIREDWLKALDLPIPANLEEYEYTLRAFRNRQDELPVPGWIDIIPFGHDGLRVSVWDNSSRWLLSDNIFRVLANSFLPSDISERDLFVYGFETSGFHHENAAREAARVLNRWAYEGIIDVLEWELFMHMLALGDVGSFVGAWDMATRAQGINYQLRQNVGPDARFISLNPFLNDEGEPVKFIPTPTDRFIFLPHTNANVIASLLYLDFMSQPDVIEFLQFGIEGIHRETQDWGGIRVLFDTDEHIIPDEYFMPSLRNFDLTLLVNGFDLGDAYKNAFIDASITGESMWDILQAREVGFSYIRHFGNFNRPGIPARPFESSSITWELRDMQDPIPNTLIRHTSPANFDAQWAILYAEYLEAGAADIINERRLAWEQAFGE